MKNVLSALTIRYIESIEYSVLTSNQLQDGPLGIDVCLTCFNGGCLGSERHHASTHYRKSGHQFTLNIKRKLKPSAQRVRGLESLHPFTLTLCMQAQDEEPPAKMTKLAIQQEREEDKYEHTTVVKCWKCETEIPNDPKVSTMSSYNLGVHSL